MSAAKPSNGDHKSATAGTTVHIHLCVPTEQEAMLPKRRRAPAYLPRDAPLPGVGAVIYLSSTSAWEVQKHIHEWRSPTFLRIEVWLDYVGSSRTRRDGFYLTQ